MLGLVVVVIALTFAVRAATKAVGASYRRRMDNWAAEHPDASRMHHRAAALGQFFATLRYGGPALKHGWKTGWVLGWETGKDWAAKHKPIPPQPTPSESATTTPPTPSQTTTPPVPPAQPRLRADGRADLRPVPTTADATAARPAPKGNSTMPIETATGGEVTSPETLVAELQAIVEEATADLEDARGDAARAEEDLGRIERMVASLTNLHLPTDDVALVAAMTDTAKARAGAAESRASAADARLGQANEALTMATRHLQLQGQAAGEFYGN